MTSVLTWQWQWATSVEDTTCTYGRPPEGTTSEHVVASSNSWTSHLILVIVLNSISFIAFIPNLAMLHLPTYLLYESYTKYKKKQEKERERETDRQTTSRRLRRPLKSDTSWLVASFLAIVKVALQMSGCTQTKTGLLIWEPSTYSKRLSLADLNRRTCL